MKADIYFEMKGTLIFFCFPTIATAMLVVATNTTTGRSGVGVAHPLYKGHTLCDLAETTNPGNGGLGLIDANASRVRYN